jgi:hypothetical protein
VYSFQHVIRRDDAKEVSGNQKLKANERMCGEHRLKRQSLKQECSTRKEERKNKVRVLLVN